MEGEAASIPGERAETVRTSRVKVYDADRVCMAAGCETRLSRYNPRKLCSIHEPVRYRYTNRVRRPPKGQA